MTLARLARGWWLALAFSRHFFAADAGFHLQQLQRQAGQTLAPGTVLLDELLAQLLFEKLDLQFSYTQPLFGLSRALRLSRYLRLQRFYLLESKRPRDNLPVTHNNL